MVPGVSVLMATAHGERFIDEAIASVLNQSYQNFEFIIVDDKSNFDVHAHLKNDPRIKVIQNPSRLGLTKSLNKAILQAQGKYIARIDDDDIWADLHKLEQQVALCEQSPDIALCGTQTIVINEAGEELYRLKFAETDQDIRKNILRANQFSHSGVLIRREALQAVGGYDESIRYAQDYELWLRLGKKYKLANLPGYFLKLRLNTTGISTKKHRAQFWSFLKTAYRYRLDYPGFYTNMPIYIREAVLNLLVPKSVFQWVSSNFSNKKRRLKD